jgi:hypothetical protein
MIRKLKNSTLLTEKLYCIYFVKSSFVSAMLRLCLNERESRILRFKFVTAVIMKVALL